MRRMRNEEGWVVVSAMVLMGIMLMVGLAILSTSDTGSKRSREQRERESSFNLTEGVLYSQAFVLAQGWPTGTGTNPAYPARCTSSSASSTQCPAAANLASASGNFSATDFQTGASWVTRVRDDYGELASAYDPAYADGPLTGPNGVVCSAPCSRDFNGDRELWVQARAITRGKPRNIAALMKLEQLQESMPQVAIASGAIAVTNNGNHGNTALVDGSGSEIKVRCEPDPPGSGGGNSNAKCTKYDKGQVTPTPQSGAPSRLMTNEQILRFRETAKVNGTYYTSCPPDNLQGAVVFVESCDPSTSAGSYQGQGASTACTPPSGMQVPCKNSLERPGLLIFRCGGMSASSNWTYVGIIYFANGVDGTCPARGNGQCEGQNINQNDVFQSTGGFGIWGAVAAEGGACMKFGSNNFQFKYDAAVFDSLVSYGTVGLVQNTWRELPANAGA